MACAAHGAAGVSPRYCSTSAGVSVRPALAQLADFANDLRVKAGASEAQILIPIDQGEELFGVADPDEAKRFLETLSHTLSESLPFMAVIAIRSDFLGQLQSAAALTARFEEFSLGPMPLPKRGSIGPAHGGDVPSLASEGARRAHPGRRL